jgi:aminoacrylate peracid reductase
MPREIIVPAGFPPPLAPYSPAVKVGNAVHVSGMVALDATGSLVGPGDCSAQTRHVLELIRSILQQAGASLADIAYNHICLKSLDDYAAMNAVYKEYFPSKPPARYCIRADLVRPDFLVEIGSVAYIGSAT